MGIHVQGAPRNIDRESEEILNINSVSQETLESESPKKLGNIDREL